jgi:transposase
MSKAKAARAFGVGISSVKRYMNMAQQGESLVPKKAPGKERKLDQGATRLLKEDLHRRPTATYQQRAKQLEELLGVQVSEATLCRAVKRLGYTRKKDCEYCDHGARDVCPWRSDPKKRGLRAFPPIRRPVRRASRRRWSKSHVTS